MVFAMVLSLDTAMLFRINPNIDEAPCLFHMSLLFMQEPSTIHSIRKIIGVRILAAQSVLPALEVSSTVVWRDKLDFRIAQGIWLGP